MPWFWRSSKSSSKENADKVRVVERQVSRGSSFSSFISRRSGSSDINWERESAGIELQPPNHSPAQSEESELSMPRPPAQTLAEATAPQTPQQQSTALMVAELEVEEPHVPAHHEERSKKSGGILNTGWRARGNSIVSLKAIGRKKSNSVSSGVQPIKDDPESSPSTEPQRLR